MAVADFIAPPRAHSGPAHPTSGVTHVRTRLTSDFTILHNSLAQRRGSAAAVGVGAYILSLPDGAPVTVDALCAHFDEGRITLSRALRELEHAGYLVRRKERWAGGVIRTRTYFRTVPGLHLPEREAPNRTGSELPELDQPRSDGTGPDATGRQGSAIPAPVLPAPVLPAPALSAPALPAPVLPAPRPPADMPTAPAPDAPPNAADERQADTDSNADADAHAHAHADAKADAKADAVPPQSDETDTGVKEPAPLGIADVDPMAVVILASLRIVDPRLVFTRREVEEMAPGVAAWLAHGIDAETITQTLTIGLPAVFLTRPARVVGYRLRDEPMPLPGSSRPAPTVATGLPGTSIGAPLPRAAPQLQPWQTCDGGCERAFRAPEPGSCRECAEGDVAAPDHTADAATGSIASMRDALRESKEARAAAPTKRRRIPVRKQPWAGAPALA
ncbi:translation initiation factor IF-2 [Streptomyces sp. NPDC008125]|uniref:translation initiation factor IF-2 n=1 Tax=Streptomyces sp. NPDC008125 TaxID=3364811 RepID=UPI0036EEACF5